jgi:hypothetical protein
MSGAITPLPNTPSWRRTQLKGQRQLYLHNNNNNNRGSRVRFTAEAGNFSLHRRVQNGSGAHPASYPVGTRALSLGVKRPGREADHSSASSAEVKERVELYTHSPIRLHGVVLS